MFFHSTKKAFNSSIKLTRHRGVGRRDTLQIEGDGVFRPILLQIQKAFTQFVPNLNILNIIKSK